MRQCLASSRTSYVVCKESATLNHENPTGLARNNVPVGFSRPYKKGAAMRLIGRISQAYIVVMVGFALVLVAVATALLQKAENSD